MLYELAVAIPGIIRELASGIGGRLRELALAVTHTLTHSWLHQEAHLQNEMSRRWWEGECEYAGQENGHTVIAWHHS